LGNVRCSHHEIDIYQRVEANRRRLVSAIIIAILMILLASGVIIFLIFRLVKIDSYFWPILPIFWLCFLTYVILRYFLGDRWILKSVKTIEPPENDPRLSAAFEAVKLASGMTQQIRLMVIGDPAINTFSISLPDGSYAIYATQGIADKLPQRERQALMAHEIAHIQMRDTLIYSLVIRMLGRSTALNDTLPFAVTICFVISLAFLRVSTLQAGSGDSWYLWRRWSPWFRMDRHQLSCGLIPSRASGFMTFSGSPR
jgi:Zn-dependent protease with chaperone function